VHLDRIRAWANILFDLLATIESRSFAGFQRSKL